MEKILTIFVLCTLLYWQSFVDSSNLDGYLVTVEHVEFNGYGRFPENVDVVLGNQGNNVYLKLARDDDATSILSEEIFETSNILPTGVFSEHDKANFAAYTAGPSDLIVIHRQSIDDKPKLYGRFTNEGEKMVIQPDGGSYVHHRVRRAENEHTRVRRATADGYVLELFVFADLSVYTHVRDEFMAPNATVKETKTFLKSYLNGIAKEVDFIFKKFGEDHGTNNTVRVYFQQYQIITDASHQEWVTDNTKDGVLDPFTVPEELRAYYETLITKFAFPTPDNLLHLTRMPMSLGLDQYPLENTPTCGNAIPTFVARIDSYPVSIAKGIAFSLGAKLDEDKGCDTADQYIMSSPFPVTNVNSPNQGNQWRFSNCSIDSIKSFFNSSSTDCLTTQDIIYDLESYDSSPTITDLLSLNEQCQLLFQRNSTICDTGAIDCFSGSQACNVSGVCESIDVPQNTPCNTGNNYVCEYGFCVSNSSQSSSSSTSTGLQTTTVTPSSTTGSTKKPDDCVVETGYVEFDLPGCGCCGGCGCEKTCSQCEPGLPAYNQSESCTKEANCCGSKVRMRTLFVPDGCELTYVQGPRTLVMEKRGWENTDTEVTAEVYQDAYERWQVNLLPKS